MSAVYLWILFSKWEIRLHRLQIITLVKLIKKERLKRFNRFKDQNTRRDSLYRYISANDVWADCQCNGRQMRLEWQRGLSSVAGTWCKGRSPTTTTTTPPPARPTDIWEDRPWGSVLPPVRRPLHRLYSSDQSLAGSEQKLWFLRENIKKLICLIKSI